MCTTPLDGKIQRKITKCYENIEIRRSKVIKKGILGYLTLQIPVSLLVCFLRACLLFCFIVCLIANALKSGHCVICIRPVGSFFTCRGEGGSIQRRDRPNMRQGRFRGKGGIPDGKF